MKFGLEGAGRSHWQRLGALSKLALAAVLALALFVVTYGRDSGDAANAATSDGVAAAVSPRGATDELAIRGLTARFDHLVDQHQNDAVAATFVENGVFEIPGQRFEGRAAIAGFLNSLPLGPPVDIGLGMTGHLGSTVHATTDNIITIDGDRATQTSYMTVFRQVPREVTSSALLVITERFDDQLVRTDAGWLFEHRTMTILQTNANTN